ncbi:hypothetical protein UPYG_G00289470 [Umbra pygmaea]|uniref:Uncharacterized protein n=1 Tax=Umbra pygmaea TaxID=75934 RepID=A0ABD0WQS0_UMBPY
MVNLQYVPFATPVPMAPPLMPGAQLTKPALEVLPATQRSGNFIAHSAISVKQQRAIREKITKSCYIFVGRCTHFLLLRVTHKHPLLKVFCE